MRAGPLVIDRLTVDRGIRRVLNEISLTLAPGDMVTLVGPNGAGKRSLLEATPGLVPLFHRWLSIALHETSTCVNIESCR